MDKSSIQALSEIILPPGSTSSDLQTAVDGAASGDTIILSGDMPFTDTVTIPEDKDITIQSDTGNNWIMNVPGSNVRHFTVRGSLILQKITMDGGNIGGGVVITGGSLTMNEGAVIQNCRSNTSGGGITANNGDLTMTEGAVVQNCYSGGNGGGAFVNPNGTIIIHGGVVKKNACFGAGGGMWFQESTFSMTAGEFSGNAANASGGAIQMLGNNTVTISGGVISGNTAGFQGGGIGISVNSSASLSDVIISGNTAQFNGGGAFIQGTATMSGVTISGNTANVLGGGIHCLQGSKTEITGKSYITNNNAPNGGGINTVITAYKNLTTGSETVFRCNWASTAHQPPMDAGTLYPDIQFASTSITDHPLNNFDINYSVGDPIDVYSNVTYDANGGTGSHTGSDIIPGGTDTVLSLAQTGITHPGYTFTSWNTESDGSGTSYTPGDMITVPCNVTLYAQWSDGEVFTVEYSANGGIGSYVDADIPEGSEYTVLSLAETEISRDGYPFTGWNTEPDGSGTPYDPGDEMTVTGNVILYAQWVAAERFTITYSSNGGIGSFEDSGRQFGDRYTIMTAIQAGITRTGYSFTGWNTEPDGSGMSYAPGDIVTITGDMRLYAQWRQNPSGKPKRLCPKPVTKCRRAIEGQKIWVDNENTGNKRPDEIEIVLLRDGEEYDRTIADAASDWAFGFCCVPVWKNTGTLYRYEIDEPDVPAGYTKTIEGYNVKNTLNP